MPEQPGTGDIEQLRGATLAVADQAELLERQTESSVAFLQAGEPTTVVMSHAVDGSGRFWYASVEGRRQVRGLDEDPRVAVVVSNTGTDLEGRRMLAIRGTARVHRDRAVIQEALGRLAPRLAPEDPEGFIRLTDSPRRVVIEITPTEVTASHDSRRLAGDGRGGSARPNG